MRPLFWARDLLLIVLGFFLSVVTTWCSLGEEPLDAYTVEGVLTYQLNKPDAPGKPFHRPFAVTCLGERWEIRARIPEAADFSQFVAQYDGTNLFSYAKFSDASANHQDSSGILEAVPVPHSSTSSGIEYIWMAYASGHYFKHLADNRAMYIHALGSASGMPRRQTLPCFRVLRQAPPFLPLEVRYTRAVKTRVGPKGEILESKLPPPFTAGYREADFVSQGELPVEGFSLPASFEYRQYMPRPNAVLSDDLFCVLEIRGAATNCFRARLLEFDKPAKTHISDRRLTEAYVHYPVTNLNVPATNSAFIASKRAEAINKVEAFKESKKRKYSWATRVIVLTAVALPVPIWLLVRRAGRRTRGKMYNTSTNI